MPRSCPLSGHSSWGLLLSFKRNHCLLRLWRIKALLYFCVHLPLWFPRGQRNTLVTIAAAVDVLFFKVFLLMQYQTARILMPSQIMEWCLRVSRHVDSQRQLRWWPQGKCHLGRKGIVRLRILYIVDLNNCHLLIGHLYSVWSNRKPCNTSVFEYLISCTNHEPLTACGPVCLGR